MCGTPDRTDSPRFKIVLKQRISAARREGLTRVCLLVSQMRGGCEVNRYAQPLYIYLNRYT